MGIRRILEADCVRDFKTGKRRFDYDPNGKRLDLWFYLERDRAGYESYVVDDNGTIVGLFASKRRRITSTSAVSVSGKVSGLEVTEANLSVSRF